MKKKKLIIGITGAFGSGKSTAASLLESKGFTRITLSSFLEKEAKRQKTHQITRKILQDIGNEFRNKFGEGILAKKALLVINKSNKYKVVVDGIRNIGEINEFKKNNNFLLLAVIVNRKVRFDRLKKLKRREDLTWEIFTRLDRRDLGLGQKKTGLHVVACQKLADIFIENNGSLSEFKYKLEKLLKLLNTV